MNDIIIIIGQWIDNLPSGIGAILILLVGWAIAKLLKLLVPIVLAWLKFDVLSEKIGIKEFLRKGNVRYSASKLIGVFLYWIVMLFALAKAASVLDKRAAETISSWLYAAIPSILATIITATIGIFIANFLSITATIGIFIANFLSNFVMTIMSNAGLSSATLVKRLIRVVGYIIVVIMVVEQLGFESIVNVLLLLLIGSVALGVAIAIGLGCKDIARQYVESFLRSLRERERASHRTDLEG